MGQFEFIADRPVLDFVATVAERGPTEDEKLQSPRDFAVWARQAGIVDGLVKVTPDHLDDARTLREALFDLLMGRIDDVRPVRGVRELINGAAARPGPALTLARDGAVERKGDFSSVLAALAQDGLALYGSPEADLLRRCADATCTRIFLDRSRGGRRRWCGMKSCGDRAKAAAYRQRRRQSPS